MHRRAVLTTLALAAAFPALAEPAPKGRALLMVEAPRCPFCAAFRREVLPGYASHPLGRAAPLTAVPIDGPWPDGLALARAPQASPTFILLENRMEIGRFEGYDDPETFWRTLGDLLA
ncbi:thioredoxin family protein [Paracoccus chinensis]|uniref:Peptide methionine sulfoxide reductase msrA/msrB n=1 Tax=Paracoccus chinensis TaxID=525640 RepID=A0A1G9GI95_9RHOB|nr:thioredoxin family protein [Paracoccus chinensis]SDL00398.1 peptide methionine sulfoxide reductase msrA/msrB [Paracoccus chinensis]